MLSLRSVSKYFHRGTPNEICALRNVDLGVAEGDFVTIIGSNGGGKSTLLGVVCGLVDADTGAIEFDGRDITRVAAFRRAAAIGRIAQDPGQSVCEGMTIEENLAMAARRGRMRGLRRAVTAASRAHFAEVLGAIGLGLETRLAVRVGTLSGGQRQALALQMATLSGARLLLLDEHLAALDPKTAETVMTLTARLVSERRLTTLMVTHRMQDAIRWGNRLAMMHAGRVIFEARDAAKAALTVDALVAKFHQAGGDLAEDRVLLAT
jgi:putative tryptophan/tyrosine transport system ATP-binding protein